MKDFTSLKNPDVARLHDSKINESLERIARPEDASGKWSRLIETLRSAQEAIPSKPRSLHQKKWETSKTTLDLVEKRKAEWDKLGSEQVKQLSKEISRSARDDYRTYVNNILEDIERENSAGNITNVFRLSRHLSSKQKSNLSVQPAIDAQGNVITSNEQQLECWAEFCIQNLQREITNP